MNFPSARPFLVRAGFVFNGVAGFRDVVKNFFELFSSALSGLGNFVDG